MRREPTNVQKPNAVALYREGVIVGHVPHNLAPRLSAFLRRDVNMAFAQVTGDGLEVPCVYRLYG